MTDRPRKVAPSASRTGFTLVEMLVVIAIIVLAMTLAIPAIRSLTGSRSVEASENAITSYIGQIRAEAIGQQQIEGVMFLLDTVTDRVMCVPVHDVTAPGDNPSGNGDTLCYFLDLIRDRDPFYLPNGIRLFVAKDGPPPNTGFFSYTDAFPSYRYLGPNFYPVGGSDPNATVYPIGVILFGADGKLVVTEYGLRLHYGSNPSLLTQLMYSGNPASNNAPADWPAVGQHKTHYLASQIGFVLVDKESFLGGGAGFLDHDNPPGNEVAVDAWLDANASPIIVNRYDGTLMRAE